MKEAVAWAKTLPKKDDADAMVTGEFEFGRVAIRVDLLSALIRGNSVVDLQMDHAIISSLGLVALFDAAQHSAAIRTLRLGSAIDFDETALIALAMLMKRSKSIRIYILGAINLGDHGVTVICQALAGNSRVRTLALTKCSIGLEGARALGNFLKNTLLRVLDIGFNFFGDEGVVALIEGLKSNTTVFKLGMGTCAISDDGAVALASLLRNGSRLRFLRLSTNLIKAAGMVVLANALEKNQNLQMLNVLKNPGVKGIGAAEAFIDALQSNATLTHLQGIESLEIDTLLLRNREEIPAVARRAALFLIVIRRSTDFEGMGNFAVLPKDVVKLLAQTVWATRRDPLWIHALR